MQSRCILSLVWQMLKDLLTFLFCFLCLFCFSLFLKYFNCGCCCFVFSSILHALFLFLTHIYLNQDLHLYLYIYPYLFLSICKYVLYLSTWLQTIYIIYTSLFKLVNQASFHLSVICFLTFNLLNFINGIKHHFWICSVSFLGISRWELQVGQTTV